MIDVAKKRLPLPAISVLVYLSFCAMSWFATRGSMAYVGEKYSMPAWFANDVWAFFIGGLLPFGLYMMMTVFVFRTLTVRLRGDVGAIRYGLNYAIIAANLVLFGLKFIYLAAPLAAGVMNTMIDPIVTLIFLAGYLYYAFRMEYVEKPYFRAVISTLLGMYIAVYGVVAMITIISSVV